MSDLPESPSPTPETCGRLQTIAEHFRLWTRRHTRSLFGRHINITMAEFMAEETILFTDDFPMRGGDASNAPQTGWSPIYFDVDSGDIMGFYCPASAAGDDTYTQAFNFLHSALPHAYQSGEGIGARYPENLLSILCTFGSATEPLVHDLVLELLTKSRMGGIRLRATVNRDADGEDLAEEIEEFAPLDTADDRFAEASFDFCALDAEHATPCWAISFSGNTWDALVELIRSRSEAAKALLRYGSPELSHD